MSLRQVLQPAFNLIALGTFAVLLLVVAVYGTLCALSFREQRRLLGEIRADARSRRGRPAVTTA